MFFVTCVIGIYRNSLWDQIVVVFLSDVNFHCVAILKAWEGVGSGKLGIAGIR